jgi:predicted permease
MAAFVAVAGLGVLVLAAAILLRNRRRPAAWLIVPGALLALGGTIAGLAAKRSAEIASSIASSAKRLISPLSNPLALEFDPTSAQPVPPDYTGFWLGMIVAAIGALAVVMGVVIAVRERRREAIDR